MSQVPMNFEPRQVFSVSALNREARSLVENQLGVIWIEGEISNLARPASGHLYFSLKDDKAQVRCALFKQTARQLGFQPQNGDLVLVRARVSLYEARGEFQLVAQSMEPSGTGALQRAFEALKKKLQAEGLFATEHKKPIPRLPKSLGVVTSTSGAALRDVLQVLKRRFPAVPVVIYPVTVQGTEAQGQIVGQLETANQRKECEVLLLVRGGGSLEDLWSFNEEAVARAIFDSELPIICGVGHEVDITIADLVADLRAPTPSAAAEMAVPDGQSLLRQFESTLQRLISLAENTVARGHEQLSWLLGRLQQQHPGRALQQRMQRVDELEQRLVHSQYRLLKDLTTRLGVTYQRLRQASPEVKLRQLNSEHINLKDRLIRAMQLTLDQQHNRLTLASVSLNQVSPLATLDRGYAIVLDKKDKVIHDTAQVQVGDKLTTRLAKGTLTTQVVEKQGEKSD